MSNNNSLNCSKEALEALIAQATNGDAVDMLKLQELLNNKVNEDIKSKNRAESFLGVAHAAKAEPVNLGREKRTEELAEHYCNPANDFHKNGKVRADSELGRQSLATAGPMITSCSEQALEDMDMFSRPMGKRKPKVERSYGETMDAIARLRRLGIRTDDYAKVKLDVLSYKDYLKSRPDLLSFKRFKSVLKKMVGYSGIGHNLTKEQKVLTIESIFSLTDGKNKDFNNWVDAVSDFIYKQKKLRFRSRFDGEDNGLIKYFDVKQYISTAVSYLLAYSEEHHKELLTKMDLKTEGEKILFISLAGLIELGYDTPHILYAILRPVLPKKGYKDFTVSSYLYKLEFSNVEYYCALHKVLKQAIIKLSVREEDMIVTTFSNLLEILENKSPEEYNKTWETYECLMINDVVALKRRLRKHRLFFEAHSICRKLSCSERHMCKCEVKERTAEDRAWDHKRLTKIIEELKIAYSFDKETEASLNEYIVDENYTAMIECLDHLACSGKMYDKELHAVIAEENCKLPYRRSKIMDFLADNQANRDCMEVYQICSEFIYGEPRY